MSDVSVGHYIELADLLLRRVRLADALTAYELALILDPWNTHAHVGKALALRGLGRHDQARAALMAASASSGHARRPAHETAH